MSRALRSPRPLLVHARSRARVVARAERAPRVLAWRSSRPVVRNALARRPVGRRRAAHALEPRPRVELRREPVLAPAERRKLRLLFEKGVHQRAESAAGQLVARYYCPWLGRWTTADPLGLQAGINVYLYVRAGPVSLSDPSGLAPDRTGCPVESICNLGRLPTNDELNALSPEDRGKLQAWADKGWDTFWGGLLGDAEEEPDASTDVSRGSVSPNLKTVAQHAGIPISTGDIVLGGIGAVYVASLPLVGIGLAAYTLFTWGSDVDEYAGAQASGDPDRITAATDAVVGDAIGGGLMLEGLRRGSPKSVGKDAPPSVGPGETTASKPKTSKFSKIDPDVAEVFGGPKTTPKTTVYHGGVLIDDVVGGQELSTSPERGYAQAWADKRAGTVSRFDIPSDVFDAWRASGDVRYGIDRMGENGIIGPEWKFSPKIAPELNQYRVKEPK